MFSQVVGTVPFFLFRIRDEKMLGSAIRDEKMFGSEINHPGSATLLVKLGRQLPVVRPILTGSELWKNPNFFRKDGTEVRFVHELFCNGIDQLSMMCCYS
jgi:hypothetical protein